MEFESVESFIKYQQKIKVEDPVSFNFLKSRGYLRVVPVSTDSINTIGETYLLDSKVESRHHMRSLPKELLKCAWKYTFGRLQQNQLGQQA